MTKSKATHVFSAPKPALSWGPSASPGATERASLVSLYSQQRFDEAENLAKRLVTQYPQHALAWKVLGAILRQTGRTQDALQPMQRAAALAPADHEAFNNLGVTLTALNRQTDAVACYEHALKLKPDFAEALGNMADALRPLGRIDEAIECYKRKLKLTPGDGEVVHHLNALTGNNTERAPDVYVEKVFDAYADTFDSHLQQTLHYQVPQKLTELVLRHALVKGDHEWRVLDLGCGTGLVGDQLRTSHPCELVGVDLSAQMLEKARQKSIYARLEQAELLAMMQAEPDASYDLVIAGDVFVYFGSLDDVVAEAHRLLRPGGAFVFTVEHLPEAAEPTPYKIQASGRYAHADNYLRELASEGGFNVLESTHTALRQDGNAVISGSLSYWRK